MGRVVSAASWGLMLPCGLAVGWVLRPALYSSSPPSEAGAAESARTGAAPRCCSWLCHMHAENALSVPAFLHVAGSFRSTQGR